MGRKTRKHPKALPGSDCEFDKLLAEMNGKQFVPKKNYEEVLISEARISRELEKELLSDPLLSEEERSELAYRITVKQMEQALNDIGFEPIEYSEVSASFDAKMRLKIRHLQEQLMYAVLGVVLVFILCGIFVHVF